MQLVGRVSTVHKEYKLQTQPLTSRTFITQDYLKTVYTTVTTVTIVDGKNNFKCSLTICAISKMQMTSEDPFTTLYFSSVIRNCVSIRLNNTWCVTEARNKKILVVRRVVELKKCRQF